MRQKSRILLYIFIGYVVLMLGMSWGKNVYDDHHHFGMSFNAERTDLGIPIIPDDWEYNSDEPMYKDTSTYEISWHTSNGKDASKGAYQQFKTIAVKEGQRISEYDLYVNNEGDSIDYELTLTYFFGKKQPWEARLMSHFSRRENQTASKINTLLNKEFPDLEIDSEEFSNKYDSVYSTMGYNYDTFHLVTTFEAKALIRADSVLKAWKLSRLSKK
jgi:hypothetical protein